MHHLILGHGYCGHYLAQYLTNHQQSVTAVSRHNTFHLDSPHFNIITHDLNQAFTWSETDTFLYYFIPPPNQGIQDDLLAQFIAQSHLKVSKVIYCSSSGVYGDQQGQWIDEQAHCHVQYERQRRRLDAEQQWQQFCLKHAIPCLILRVAGIYGPQRLPIEAARQGLALIHPDESPFSNHIYVEDLAAIIASLGQCAQGVFNVADGQPQLMGSLQHLTAKYLGLPTAPYQPFAEVWQQASSMKREFMSASKRLHIGKLQASLKSSLQLISLSDGIQRSLTQQRNTL